MFRSAVTIGGELWRYTFASAAALAVDFSLLFVLTQYVGLHYLVSAAISYSAGAVLHYVLSVAFVFRNRSVRNRRLEFIGFFVVGLLGLAATQVVLKVTVEAFGMNYLHGKVIATGVSFLLNFLVRKVLLFTLRPSRADHRHGPSQGS